MFSALRYRLWNVDVVLNRTLVYSLVTIGQIMIFVLGLLLVRSLLTALVGSEQTGLALAGASALAAVTFNPVRKQARRFVDVNLYGLRFDLNELKDAQNLPEIKHPGALSGRKLGEYEVLDAIGKGGMGEVYKGQAGEQTVALKILPDDLAQQEHFRQRFQREGEALTALQHPNIVKMIAAGESEGVSYLAMEYVEGEELGRKLKAGGALPLEDSRDILKGLASALDYAHERGFVHRDIKPSNVMLRRNRDGERWEAVLMDFGVAKVREAASGLTQTGAIGTIDYMAPEQIMAAKEVDQRADVYALGVMAYEMLTGERPYKGSAAQIMFAHLQQPPPDPRDMKDGISREAAQAIMQAMAKKPDERFESAGAFAAALSL
jgi:serine/threonine-protein kinase